MSASKPARILVIPGLGDIHWIALKLQSFIARHCSEPPELWVWNFDGRPRSEDFVRLLPFVRWGGYWDEPLSKHKAAFNRSYMEGGRDVVEGFEGFDWFLCFNGSLRVGKSLERDILPGYAVDWSYPMLIPDESEAFARRLSAQIGPYVMLYFSDHGMFQHWLKRWPDGSIRLFINEAKRLLPGHRFILTGSSWDAEFAGKIAMPGVMNLVGKTSFRELLGMTMKASAFAGWCGGNTILASHLNTPTVMIWSRYFKDERFRSNWINAERVESVYFPREVEALKPTAAAALLREIVVSRESRRAA